MTYTVLARRYRSNTFGEVIGQEPISRTLQSAIAAGRVAHAYLFTGTRGVGKTSMARILARALNAPDTIPDCPKPEDHDQYPDHEQQERMAEAIMRGEDLNVIEIDGASNNSVDQARQLIANAGLSPTDQARHKVYIIDEVHMLSQAAFNALLKTMEEPPAHVKFILCTTEAHKVPATIQSRCQRFDFRNIPTARIAEHLRSVLDLEKIKAEDDVVWQLARLGNGSMRDALSVLDRLMAAAGAEGLTAPLLEQMLGLPSQDLVVQMVDAMAGGNVAATLELTSQLLDRGIAQDQLIEVLIERLRQLMLIIACGSDSELVELSDVARQSAAEQAKKFDAPALVHMIALCENLQRFARSSSNARALLDATMVRLALSEKMADVTALLAGEETGVSSRVGSRGGSGGGSGTTQGDGEGRKKKVAPESPKGRGGPDEGAPPRGAGPRVPGASSAPMPKEPSEIWQSVLAATAATPSLSWVTKLQLTKLDGQTAHISAPPGRRDLTRFAEQQRDRLEQLFRSVSDLPIRVRIESTSGKTAADARGGAAGEPGEPGQTVADDTDRIDTKRAMALPLVRQVVEHFDVSVLDARKVSPKQEKWRHVGFSPSSPIPRLRALDSKTCSTTSKTSPP